VFPAAFRAGVKESGRKFLCVNGGRGRGLVHTQKIRGDEREGEGCMISSCSEREWVSG
jgi:hypothetical protein